jgi:hypothetical protein
VRLPAAQDLDRQQESDRFHAHGDQHLSQPLAQVEGGHQHQRDEQDDAQQQGGDPRKQDRGRDLSEAEHKTPCNVDFR